MTERPDPEHDPLTEDDSLSPAELAQLISVCDRFEAAFGADERPRIEEYLAGVPERLRDRLSRELRTLATELEQERDQTKDRWPRDDRTARNVLFGILVLQNGFIDRDALLGAFKAWVADKTRPIGRVLVENGALTQELLSVLEILADAHLRQHESDPEQSLAALSSVSTAREALGKIDDRDVQATLEHLGLASTDSGSGLEATSMSLGRPTATGGRFQLLRFHARGGLGEVFIARDQEVRREVALKQIQSEAADDPQRRSRFLMEAEITGGLEHPGIVPVYGLGSYPDGRPFYAMRFIRGDNLRDAIKRFHGDVSLQKEPGRRSLRLRDLLGRFLDVCDAIAYAHSRGVLHRDLKPSNVMLGPYGETLVVDWGLAKAFGKPMESSATTQAEATLMIESGSDALATSVGAAQGTPAYMPPEQAAGRLDELGPASDVYSLGATLYTVLTGRPPFRDKDVPSLLRKVERAEFAPPRSLQPWIDPALEAVCLKAMSLKQEDRYGSPRALAEDLQRWMADEPVSAWREPWPRGTRRWVGRHRTMVTTASAAVLVLVLALVAYATQRLVAARGRVEALATAEILAVPHIVRELGDDRALVRHRLRALADAAPGRSGRIAASLALLADEPQRADTLVNRLIGDEEDVPPEEVLVIRKALADQGLLKGQVSRLAAVLEKPHNPLTTAQFRALGILALAEPESALWTKPLSEGADVPGGSEPRSAPQTLAGLAADSLTQENPLRFDAWREVFQPAAQALVKPLRVIYGGSEVEPRDRAYTFLFAFANRPENPSGPEDLAVLLVEAEPSRMSRILGLLSHRADRARAIAALEQMLEPVARFDVALAERQGRVAVALMLLEAPDRVWPLFAFRDDPSLRTELIHEFARYGIDPRSVAGRLRTQGDMSVRRALVLCLGEYSKQQLAEADSRALEAELLKWYRESPDPGLHSAVDWLLRQRWGLGERVAEIDKELASPDLPQDRDWFVNGQGQTYAMTRKPVTFMMGLNPECAEITVSKSAQEAHAQRLEQYRWHRRHIPRAFAIATREVTVAEYTRFLDSHPNGVEDHRAHPHYRALFRTADCSIGDLDWFAAASYCNWLSQQEGLPKDQWCYPDRIGPGMELPKDHLQRTGYRLPTEGEWEYAGRSGCVTVRPCGDSKGRLPKYAWFASNSGSLPHAPGVFKPNDLGLFDVVGNVSELCCDPAVPDWTAAYRAPQDGAPLIDELIFAEFIDDNVRRFRGGSFLSESASMNLATSGVVYQRSNNSHAGLRPVRTLPRGSAPRITDRSPSLP